MISSAASRSICTLCNQNYYKEESRCIALADSQKIPNCFHHIDGTPSILCTHCSNGLPTNDLTSCSEWSQYTGAANLANCEIATRPQPSSEPHCYRCKTGFSYDLTTKSCITTPIEGCWETKDAKCQSCEAWNGWYSDGIDSSTGATKCLKGQDHQKDLVVIPAPESDTITSRVLNKSEPFLAAQNTSGITFPLKGFREFKDGYLLIDQTGNTKKYNPASKRFESLEYGPEGNPMTTYTGHINPENQTGPVELHHPHKKETLTCFYFSSYCATVYTPISSVDGSEGIERVLVFKAKNSILNGDVYFNKFSKEGKSITGLLPITKSSYLILGFSTDSRLILGGLRKM